MFELVKSFVVPINSLEEIKKAYEELKQLSDLYFEYEEVKKNKKVESIIFYIKKKSSVNIKTIELAEVPNIDEGLLERLKPYSIPDKTILKWIDGFGIDRIALAIDYLSIQIKKGTKIPNVAGYLHKMISTDHLEKIDRIIFKIKI